MQLTTKQAESLELMERLSFVDFTTIDPDGFPSTRAMLNLRNKQNYPHFVALHEAESNPLTVFLTTNTSSEKVGVIRQNAKACLYYCDAAAFHAVLLHGTVEIVTDNALRQKAWQKGWEVYYPKGDADYTLLRFTPTKLKTYSDFSAAAEEVR